MKRPPNYPAIVKRARAFLRARGWHHYMSDNAFRNLMVDISQFALEETGRAFKQVHRSIGRVK